MCSGDINSIGVIQYTLYNQRLNQIQNLLLCSYSNLGIGYTVKK